MIFKIGYKSTTPAKPRYLVIWRDLQPLCVTHECAYNPKTIDKRFDIARVQRRAVCPRSCHDVMITTLILWHTKCLICNCRNLFSLCKSIKELNAFFVFKKVHKWIQKYCICILYACLYIYVHERFFALCSKNKIHRIPLFYTDKDLKYYLLQFEIFIW